MAFPKNKAFLDIYPLYAGAQPPSKMQILFLLSSRSLWFYQEESHCMILDGRNRQSPTFSRCGQLSQAILQFTMDAYCSEKDRIGWWHLFPQLLPDLQFWGCFGDVQGSKNIQSKGRSTSRRMKQVQCFILACLRVFAEKACTICPFRGVSWVSSTANWNPYLCCTSPLEQKAHFLKVLRQVEAMVDIMSTPL